MSARLTVKPDRDRSIIVELCCNDYRNGLSTGKCDALQIYSNASFIAATRPAALRVEPLAKRMRFAGRSFEIHGFKEWTGNWCWDSVKMRGEDVIDLLNWTVFRRMFTIEDGETSIVSAWERGMLYTLADLAILADKRAMG